MRLSFGGGGVVCVGSVCVRVRKCTYVCVWTPCYNTKGMSHTPHPTYTHTNLIFSNFILTPW